MNFKNLFAPRKDAAEIAIDVMQASIEELRAESQRLAEIQDACKQRRRALNDIIEARLRNRS
jgi:hypothetical protein